MRHEEQKGSVVTSVITACIFVLILAVFGKSVQGERYQLPSAGNQSAAAATSTVVGAGFYWTHVLDEGKHHFLQPLKSFD